MNDEFSTIIRAEGLIPTLAESPEAVRAALEIGPRRRRDDLPACIVRHFFPELRRLVGRRGEAERYRRPGWRALAQALIHLAAHHPRSAFALLQPGAEELGNYLDRVRRAELRIHP